MTEQEIRQQILQRFYSRLAADPAARAALRRIDKGKATLADTAALSDRAADLLGEVFGAAVLDIPEDVREAVCESLLRERHDYTMNTCDEVLEVLDSAQGLHLTPQHPGFPIERVQQLASSLTDPTVKPETIRRRASKPVATVAKSFHDSYIRINAQTRHNLGIKCYLDRVAAPGCCAWCTGIAGRYVYGEHPADIFRRHDNCSCTVTFENGRERQDVWSKRTWDAKDPKEIERVASRPARLSQQQAEQLQENAVSRLTLGGRRDIMRVADSGSIYHKITDESIRNVPLVDAFGDAEKNERYREANRALLREAAKYEPGVEVSMVYDADMKAIDGFGYVLGEMGHVRIENPGVPFHAFHNHGSGETLSFADARAFVNNSSWISVTAVGNTGSVYSLTRTAYSDSFGFGCFLRNKSRTVIFSAEGTDFTLEKIADENVSKDLKLIVSRLPAEQKKSLADAILSQTEKCLKGGAKYGFKYTEITP